MAGKQKYFGFKSLDEFIKQEPPPCMLEDGTTTTVGTAPVDVPVKNGESTFDNMKRKFSREEQEIIDCLTRSLGRPLTEQEINLALEQARHIGEL